LEVETWSLEVEGHCYSALRLMPTTPYRLEHWRTPDHGVDPRSMYNALTSDEIAKEDQHTRDRAASCAPSGTRSRASPKLRSRAEERRVPCGHAPAVAAGESRWWCRANGVCPIIGAEQRGASRRAHAPDHHRSWLEVLGHRDWEELLLQERLNGAALKVGIKVGSDKKGSKKSSGDWAREQEKHRCTNGKIGGDKHEDVSLVRDDPIWNTYYPIEN
jgi:hypothetical protein